MPERSPLILLGAGGHALVVAEAARLGGWTLAGFLDDDPSPVLATGDPAPTQLGGLDALDALDGRAWIIAIGDLAARRRLLERLGDRPGSTTVAHPDGHIAPTAAIGAGAFIGPRAVVHTRASVGDHAIINTGAIVEHECRIGANTHIAPGAVLGGRVSVGEDTLVGLGSRVLPNVRIGDRCIIGAGAVVTNDIPDGAVAVGAPARLTSSR